VKVFEDEPSPPVKPAKEATNLKGVKLQRK